MPPGSINPRQGGQGADDASEAAKLRDALDMLAKGRPVQDLGLGLVPGTRFHVLGLAPNAARLSVRYWLDDSFDAFAARLADHYRDLAIEPPPWGAKPPSIQRLLVKTTALQEKFDNIPPLLAGEVMRAVLSGTRYPRTLADRGDHPPARRRRPVDRLACRRHQGLHQSFWKRRTCQWRSNRTTPALLISWADFSRCLNPPNMPRSAG